MCWFERLVVAGRPVVSGTSRMGISGPMVCRWIEQRQETDLSPSRIDAAGLGSIRECVGTMVPLGFDLERQLGRLWYLARAWST